MNLYFITQGSKIGINDGQIYIENKEEKIYREYPSKLIENIFIYGNIFITTQAIKFFLKERIRVIFLSINGDYIGSLVSIDQKNVFLKYLQYEIFKKQEKRLILSKKIIKEKINSQKEMIFISCKNQKKENFYQDFKNKIDFYENKIENLENLEELRGIEGIIQKNYFDIFKDLINNSDFYFKERTHYPPKDEINSLLSFGYTLLVNFLTGFIIAKNLDPYLGFFHENEYKRENLSLDLIEPFRSHIDRLVLNLINLKIIKKDDFLKEKDKILIKQDFIKKIFYQFQKKFIENEKIIRKIENNINFIIKFIHNEKNNY